jgi:predicted ATPase
MRIAVSGTHFSGKSTLVEELSSALPEYSTVDEPYYLLEEEGYEFAEPPSVEDFEQQLERALTSLEAREPNVIFDRCPADFLGYLLTHPDAEAFDLEAWLPRVQSALKTLDLIVFVPIEGRDRIALPRSQDPRFRIQVDEELNEILLENSLNLDVEVLQVTGSPHERLRQVLAHLHGGTL